MPFLVPIRSSASVKGAGEILIPDIPSPKSKFPGVTSRWAVLEGPVLTGNGSDHLLITSGRVRWERVRGSLRGPLGPTPEPALNTRPRWGYLGGDENAHAEWKRAEPRFNANDAWHL